MSLHLPKTLGGNIGAGLLGNLCPSSISFKASSTVISSWIIIPLRARRAEWYVHRRVKKRLPIQLIHTLYYQEYIVPGEGVCTFDITNIPALFFCINLACFR